MGSLESANMILAASISVLFLLSATPFYYGVLEALNCLSIPFSSQKLSRSLFLDSVPLSDVMTFTFRLAWFYILVMNDLSRPLVSSFVLRKYTQVNLVKSSIITKQ